MSVIHSRGIHPSRPAVWLPVRRYSGLASQAFACAPSSFRSLFFVLRCLLRAVRHMSSFGSHMSVNQSPAGTHQFVGTHSSLVPLLYWLVKATRRDPRKHMHSIARKRRPYGDASIAAEMRSALRRNSSRSLSMISRHVGTCPSPYWRCWTYSRSDS
jgi:hypothetical protein